MTSPRQTADDAFYRRAEACSVEAWLSLLGHRWNALVLYHLSLSPKRFGEISNELPDMSPKVLSERLVVLERRGVIVREGGRGGAYSLTDAGVALMPILHALEVWARPMAPA